MLGRLRLDKITRRHIIALMEKRVKQAPIQANRALATLKKLFSYAVDVGVLEANPAASVKPPAKENVKNRVLSLQELSALFKALEEQPKRDAGDVLKLIALTGVKLRPNAVLSSCFNKTLSAR